LLLDEFNTTSMSSTISLPPVLLEKFTRRCVFALGDLMIRNVRDSNGEGWTELQETCATFEGFEERLAMPYLSKEDKIALSREINSATDKGHLSGRDRGCANRLNIYVQTVLTQDPTTISSIE
jgi:hypothetical protein